MAEAPPAIFTLTERFSRALTLANELHAGHLRKGTSIPYASHLLAVTSLVLEQGGNEDEAIAALLHDVIEDRADVHGGAITLRARLRAECGDHVVTLIDGCTDAETTPKPPWRERKLAHLHHLATAPTAVLSIVVADKLHNARCTLAELEQSGPSVWNRFKTGREGTLWNMGEVLTILKSCLPGPMTHEFGRIVGQLSLSTEI